MPRYKLTIEYDGRPFCGWQLQPQVPTVQGFLQHAIKKFSGLDVVVEGAGRTDAGVHALGQVAHVDLSRQDTPYRVQRGLNFFLDECGISVVDVEEVDPTFHARFSAKRRQYVYRIINRRAPLAVEKGLAWQVPMLLDVEKMVKGASMLVGVHDFTSFRSINCQAPNPIRLLDRFDLEQNGPEITGIIESRAFLHNQVRIMMGTLKMIGEGRWTLKDLQNALEAKDRTQGGVTAPPHGLYFSKVFY
ncbi:tRNA pseudouridine(38-40) synthase TruA [Candidatus Odyssella acanthamoebae]|uniref:tRNA pseudouridine synthase A n=1 Tax=Candidatus Odyssella acanthamoebae TaxID=91604 RepID=A0A077AVW6_9PROT|nr:tRNA pseudouridine(38-40) synthase TruA [Candidatus Paracaedibacter acanthamoebae]AIK97297.1 pseudouridine synthase [Candidatus Paracaedibacter acanthamoebae]